MEVDEDSRSERDVAGDGDHKDGSLQDERALARPDRYGRAYFLTYSGSRTMADDIASGEAEPDPEGPMEILERLLGLACIRRKQPVTVEYAIVGVEPHADGRSHFHALIIFGGRVKFGKRDIGNGFDLAWRVGWRRSTGAEQPEEYYDVAHPKVYIIKTGDWPRVRNYCRKDGNIAERGDWDATWANRDGRKGGGGSTKRAHPEVDWKAVIALAEGAATERDFAHAIAEEEPGALGSFTTAVALFRAVNRGRATAAPAAHQLQDFNERGQELARRLDEWLKSNNSRS